MSKSNYEGQDRGDGASYQQYLEAMDAIAVEKVASASVFFHAQAGGTLIDVGMASGTSTAILAKLFPEQQLVGVDINPQMVDFAQQKYQASNLSFRVDDGETLSTFEEGTVDGFFNCSAIHHITSYNDYDNNRAYASLARQAALLRVGGVLVVRDFVKPELQEVILELSSSSRSERPSDPELLILFAQHARALAPAEQRGFPLEELKPEKEGFRRFKLFNTDAVEFIRRKDYYANWDIELQEEYAYFTQAEFESALQRLGLRIILSAPIYNAWIINNRYKDQFRWFDLAGTEIGFPPTNYIIAAEKVEQGTALALIRHVASAEEPFLQRSAYREGDGGPVYDVVRRANPVQDILAYQQSADGIRVLAKQGYPRPIINALAETALDGKKFSGYIIEGITLATTASLAEEISKRFKLPFTQELQELHRYYTSPGALDEQVCAYAVALSAEALDGVALQAGYSGFKTSGHLQAFDAAQLLETAQTGALVEARLEMNLYLLFVQKNMALPPWLGEKIVPIVYEQIDESSLPNLLAEKRADFEASELSADFLKVNRAYFSEIGVDSSHATLEYVIPTGYSANTLITLPICKVAGQVYVGLEQRSLPVPQLHEGNSLLLTVPAIRLPKEVKNNFDLTAFKASMKFGRSKVLYSAKLGEKYFPSIGISPEQVYPFVVCLDVPDESLKWVALAALEQQLPKLRDAHLLICIHRLRHALKN